MDNPKAYDFLVVVRYILCASLCALLTWACPAAARDADMLAQAEENTSASASSIQKIQRLLKLLASRYPGRYGSVDPGRVDGVYGEDTKIAIRNFRAIAGLLKHPRPDNQLEPDILAELARVTAATPEASQPESKPACAQVSAGQECDESSAAAADPVTTAAAARQPETAGAASDAGMPPPPPAPRALDDVVQSTSQATSVSPSKAPALKPPVDTAPLYFVQVASLRSVDSAQKEWARIRDENRAAIRDGHSHIERAEVDGRGTFYRVLIGPLANRDDANTLCGSLKQNGQTCVVTQRSATSLKEADALRTTPSEAGIEQASTAQRKQVPPPAATAPVAAAAVEPAAGAAAQGTASPPAPAGIAPSVTAPPASPAAPGSSRGATETAALPQPPIASRPAVTAPALPPLPAPGIASAPATGKPAGAPSAADSPSQATPPPASGPAPSGDLGDHVAIAATEGTHSQTPPMPIVQAPPAADGVAVAAARTVWHLLKDFAAPGLLAIILVSALLLYSRRKQARRTAVGVSGLPDVTVADAFALPGMEDDASGEIPSLSVLENAFDSQRLQDSRRVRDAFLREVLYSEPDHPSDPENRESAILVNSCLKKLLATNPDQYKSIFLNLIFLSKVGAALNRKVITLDQMNNRLNREFDLLQSYFKIHLLELDDRHRIRKELPGLFYCLQLSQLQRRPESMRFSAA